MLDRLSLLPRLDAVPRPRPGALRADLGRRRRRLRDGLAGSATPRAPATSWPGPRSSPTRRSCGSCCARWGAGARSSTSRCSSSRGRCALLEQLAGPRAFATWDEIELMEVSRVAARGRRATRAASASRRGRWRRCSGSADERARACAAAPPPRAGRRARAARPPARGARRSGPRAAARPRRRRAAARSPAGR